MPRPLFLAMAAAVLATTAASAQGTLVVSSNKCAFNRQGEIRRMNDSLWIPVAQELVNEGRLIAAGSAYHAWGDEWNVVVWYTATDIPTFLSAASELFRRIGQRHPNYMTQMLSLCTEHKDSFYSVGASTVPGPAQPPRQP